ncbi:MAG TPA: VTT domain-containing protein [Candidatus Chromulinivoraceae bacterium]|nr:VTT domain-containing protein [Candidatus Chromulinivoraceae bacterium]
MIPGFDFTSFASTAGPWLVMAVVAAIIFAESGLLIGFFLPGDSILFTAGFLISVHLFNFSIHLFVVLIFLAAVLGDGVGYIFGKRVGRRLFSRPNSLLFRQENIKKAEEFYEKHGGVTVILARFIPVVRTFVPIIAGVGKMSYRTFLSYNVVGALLWAAGVAYAGFYIGEFFNRLGIGIDSVLLPIVTLIVIVSVLPPLIHILKDKRQRTIIWNGTKKQFRVLFRKK